MIPKLRTRSSASLSNVAVRLEDDHAAEALALCRCAVEKSEAVYRVRPSDLVNARFLTIQLGNVARLARLLGDLEATLAAHRRRIEVLDRRARDDPEVPGVHAELVDGYRQLLAELQQGRRWEEAARVTEAARAQIKETTDDDSVAFLPIAPGSR